MHTSELRENGAGSCNLAKFFCCAIRFSAVGPEDDAPEVVTQRWDRASSWLIEAQSCRIIERSRWVSPLAGALLGAALRSRSDRTDRSNGVVVDRIDEFVHLAAERFHLLAELAHHLASDLVNLFIEREDLVIDLLVDLVQLVHEELALGLGFGDGTLGFRERDEHGFHLIDVFVVEDFVRTRPLDRDRADGGALAELRVRELQHSDRVGGELRILRGRIEGDVAPSVDGAEEEETLVIDGDVRMHVLADDSSVRRVVRDEGRDYLVLVGDERHRLPRFDFLGLGRAAKDGLLLVAAERVRGRHLVVRE